MSTVTIPTLPHRAPANTYVTELPETLTADWLSARFDELDQRMDAAGVEPEAWEQVILHLNELVSHVYTVFSRVRLAFRQASDDESATAENKRLNHEISPVWSARSFAVATRVASSPCLDHLEQRFSSHWRRQLETEVRIGDPVNIELRTKLSDVLMEYTAIFGTATVTWRGDTLPISYARKAQHDADRTERHAAHRSVLDFIVSKEQRIQEIFDEAAAMRREMASNLGLDSFIEMRYLEMGRHDWTKSDAASFRSAVAEHVVPVARALRTVQAAQLGTELVHPADTEIWDDGAPDPQVEIDEQLEVATRVFGKVGSAFGDPFATMVDEDLIDLPARPGKGTGAFCTSFPDQKVPYIFCNSVGAAEDVKTLVHEYGHALQGWRSSGIELVEMQHPTLEACEIHSMTLELLVHPYMDEFFGDKAEQFRHEHLRSTLLVVPYMAQVDEFQHRLYAPDLEPLDADGRMDLWKDLTLRYRPGLDWQADEDFWRGRWLMQLHVFQSPFYYLDYALARMVSWQLWLDSLEDRERALQTYLNLCDAGGTKPFRQLVRESGLADPFDPAVVADTMQRLRPHLGL